MLPHSQRDRPGSPSQVTAVSNAGARIGREIALRVDKVDLRADQAVGQGPGAATLLPQLHSSRETEAARSDHR